MAELEDLRSQVDGARTLRELVDLDGHLAAMPPGRTVRHLRALVESRAAPWLFVLARQVTRAVLGNAVLEEELEPHELRAAREAMADDEAPEPWRNLDAGDGAELVGGASHDAAMESLLPRPVLSARAWRAALPAAVGELQARPELLRRADRLGQVPASLDGTATVAGMRRALEACVSAEGVQEAADRIQQPAADRPWVPLTLDAPEAVMAVRAVLAEVGVTLALAAVHAKCYEIWAEAIARGQDTPACWAELEQEVESRGRAVLALVPARIRAGVPLAPSAISDRAAVEQIMDRA